MPDWTPVAVTRRTSRTGSIITNDRDRAAAAAVKHGPCSHECSSVSAVGVREGAVGSPPPTWSWGPSPQLTA